MIKILGTRRIFVLTVLVCLNALLGAIQFMYLQPEVIKSDKRLRAVKGRVTSLQRDITRLDVEFQQLEEQKERFEDLQRKDFLREQDRRKASDLLEEIQRASNVISAVASIQPATIIQDEEAAKANYDIVASPINVEIKAMSDIDVYRYIALLTSRFPGHVSLDSLSIKRASDITSVALRSIANGGSPPLVEANVLATWRTLTKKPDMTDGQGR